MIKCDSIIFDLDGTLWDGVATYAKAWSIYFKKIGINKVVHADDIYCLMGQDEKTFLSNIVPEFDYKKQCTIYKNVEKIQSDLILSQGGILFDGVEEGLKKLSSKYKLFIVSNCSKDTIKCFLKYFKLEDIFTDHIAHGENYKDKTYNINLIIQRNNLKSSIYVGDTESDQKHSKEAGVPFVFAEYGFGKVDSYWKKIKNFSELVNF